MRNVLRWIDNCCLSVNAQKCKSMDIITKKNIHIDPVLLSDNSPMVQTSTVNILGCCFSSDLKWNSNILNLLRKASKRIYILLHLKRSGCPAETIFSIYCALIRPVLLYGYPAWCNIPDYLKRQLFSVEKRALRIIGEELSDHLSLFTMGDNICLKLFKNVESQRDHPLRCFF